jgi:ribosomal protein L40E
MPEPPDQPESRRFANYQRYSLAALACFFCLALYIPFSVVVYLYVLLPAHDWVDRQGWLLRNVGGVVLWIVYFIVIALGWALIQHIWKYIAGSRTEASPAPIATEKRICPRCGSEDEWDGRKCGECGFTHNPWKKGTKTTG